MSILDLFRKVFGTTVPDSLIASQPRPVDLPVSEQPNTVPTVKSAKKGKVSADAIELVQHFESCLSPNGDGRFKAYPDLGYGWKVPTIGWGTTVYKDGSKVKRGDIISQKKADAEFAYELEQKAKGVSELITAKITGNEFGALVSFAYNAGTGALKKSTLLKKLNAGDKAGAAEQFLRWNKTNGQVAAGLTRRRNAERSMFLGEDWRAFVK